MNGGDQYRLRDIDKKNSAKFLAAQGSVVQCSKATIETGQADFGATTFTPTAIVLNDMKEAFFASHKPLF